MTPAYKVIDWALVYVVPVPLALVVQPANVKPVRVICVVLLVSAFATPAVYTKLAIVPVPLLASNVTVNVSATQIA